MSQQSVQSRDDQDPFAEQRRTALEQRAVAAAVKSQQEQVQQVKRNPDFYRTVADLNIDDDISEMYEWVPNEIGVKAAPGFTLGNRDEEYVFEQSLLNKNWGERLTTERQPGRLWKKNPVAHAVVQGLDGTECVTQTDNGRIVLTPTEHEDFVAPLTNSGDRRQYRDLADLQTNRESLAVDSTLLDALATATTEHRQHNENEQETDRAGRIARFLGK